MSTSLLQVRSSDVTISQEIVEHSRDVGRGNSPSENKGKLRWHSPAPIRLFGPAFIGLMRAAALGDKMEDQKYYELACDLAIDAAENHSDSNRGIWHLEREDLLCIYDNSPYSDVEARPRQNRRIAERLRDQGIRILALAHDGREESTTMLLDCSWDRVPLVHQIVCDEVDETLRELYSDF